LTSATAESYRTVVADGFEVVGAPIDVEKDAAGLAACLADEIAIDFPSLGAIRERMRRAFFAGDVDASHHSAEIAVTPHEAFHGTRVAFDVPVSITCGSCGGRGEVWMDPCGACGGAGAAATLRKVSLTLPAGVRDGARFRFSVGPPSAPPTPVEVRIVIR
jgi:hypothetical protein